MGLELGDVDVADALVGEQVLGVGKDPERDRLAAALRAEILRLRGAV